MAWVAGLEATLNELAASQPLSGERPQMGTTEPMVNLQIPTGLE